MDRFLNHQALDVRNGLAPLAFQINEKMSHTPQSTAHVVGVRFAVFVQPADTPGEFLIRNSLDEAILMCDHVATRRSRLSFACLSWSLIATIRGPLCL